MSVRIDDTIPDMSIVRFCFCNLCTYTVALDVCFIPFLLDFDIAALRPTTLATEGDSEHIDIFVRLDLFLEGVCDLL